MEDIRGMVDRLAELSEAELGELESAIIQAFEAVEGQDITRESVAEMTFLADSVESVRAELSRRDQEKAELVAEAAQAATRITEATASADAEEDVAEGEEEKKDEEEEPPGAFAAEETPAPEAAPEPAVVELATEPEPVAEPAAAELATEPEPVAEPVPAAELATAPEPVAEQAPAVELATEPVAEQAAEAAVTEAAAKEDEEEDKGKDEDKAEAATETLPEAEAAVGPPIEEEEDSAEVIPVDELPVEEVPAEDLPPVPEEEEEEIPVFANADGTTTSTEAQMEKSTAGPTFSAPADRLPAPTSVSPAPVSLVAGGDIPGITAGSPLSGRLALAEAFTSRLHGLRRASGGTGEQVVVASLMAQFPEDRILRANEVDSNSAKIKDIVDPTTIVASGGWCAPLPVNYDLFDIGGSTAKPLRDSLPVFNADRGGVRYVKSPVITDYDGAVNIWTAQDDIDAETDDTKRKKCLKVECAEEEAVYLDAVTTCLCFGNLQTRAFPELIARHNDLALIQAARFEELYILNRLKALSQAVALPAVLGTARDILISVERAAVAYRYKHRLDPKLPLRFVAPLWLHSMVRSDLTAQLPGDGMDTTFNLADSTIDSFFNHRNIRPVWTLEGYDVPTVTDYPDQIEWGLWAEGTFTLLDGGTLDIGIVRDMELVSKNDYCMFTEEFLAVAKTGLDSLWVTQQFNVNGGSAGTLDVASVDY